MTDISTDFFDFGSLINGTSNPFEDATAKYEADTRFYTLPKNENGEGKAIIAFLPDANKVPLKKVIKYNLQNNVNGKRRFISVFSPSTIGLPDPFQEKWQELWNAGEKEESRKYRRSIRYVTNIKVIKDPLKPENNGKIFLYEISQTLRDKLNEAINPSPEDLELGNTRKEIFNPLRGWMFVLTAKKGSNGILNYNSSEFVNKPDLIPYKSAQEAIDDIRNNTYSLDWFDNAENYLSYDALVDKMNWLYNPSLVKSDVKVVQVKDVDVKEPEVRSANDVSELDMHESQAQAVASTVDNAIDDLLSDL